MTDVYEVEGRRFGRHVRSLRKTRGLTQEALARKAGLSGDTIRRLEGGTFSPSLTTLVRLSRGLELRLSTILASYEIGMLPVERELADLLSGRDEKELRIVLEVVKVLLRDWGEGGEGSEGGEGN